MLKITKEIRDLIDQGAIFYCSHSGGKDSQAMYYLLGQVIPKKQIVVVHADLGRVEWKGVQEHIRNTVDHPVNVVVGNWIDGRPKDLLDMVERRHAKRPDSPCWPSAAMRYCTSDLKRDPIAKFIRNDLKARGGSVAVNCVGLRAEESSARAHRKVWSINKRQTIKSRTVFDWLPVHDLLTAEIFQVIAEAGQAPFWAYQENDRLSCVFCVMGCAGDLAHGARQRPELYQEYLNLEIRTGWTMFNGQSLAAKVAEAVS